MLLCIEILDEKIDKEYKKAFDEICPHSYSLQTTLPFILRLQKTLEIYSMLSNFQARVW